MADTLLRTEKLSKKYGSRFALKDVDVHIRKGDIYGLIGRNGAGKTTLMKIINNQIHQTSGNVYYGGNLKKDRGQLIGALVESPNLYLDCSARENLVYKCITLGIKQRNAQIQNLLDIVELADTGKKKAKQFSLGMKQRLGIALALVGDPDVLMLDEPINGMDPQGIASIREMLVRLNKERGTTILISSHILDELGKFATTYGIIKDGLLLTEFNRAQLEEENLSSIQIRSPQMDRVQAVLTEKMALDVSNLQQDGSLVLHQHAAQHRDISRLLFDSGIYLEEFHVQHQTLEEYFMKLTGGAEIA